MKALALFIAVFLVWQPSVHGHCHEKNSTTAIESVVRTSNIFSLTLYQALSVQAGNLVFSSFGVVVLLIIAWLGAGGESARQIADVLQLPDDRDEIEAGFSAVISAIQSQSEGSADFIFANKVYIQLGINVLLEFRQYVTQVLRSDIELVDFRFGLQIVRSLINQWIAAITRNRIRNLIADAFTSSTRLALVNVIYYNQNWLLPFDSRLTTTESFFLVDQTVVSVSMMHQTGFFFYAYLAQYSCSVLRLEYVGGFYSLFIILPDSADGITALESQLSALNLTSGIEGEVTLVNVTLPKFSIEVDLQFRETIQTLGIMDVFNEGGSLSGISSSQLFVNSISQKVLFEVTETGTEEISVTYEETTQASVQFTANYNFLFVVVDNFSGLYLLQGRCANPKT